MDFDFSQLWTLQALVALLTLTSLEVVLGIDNLVFIAILTGKLPKDKQRRAWIIGIGGAMVVRILLLLTINWLMRLTEPLMPNLPWRLGELSGKDLIVIVGGLFLIAKATWEIHDKLEAVGHEEGAGVGRAPKKLAAVVFQIMLIDIVFSLDSVITAVGMSDQVVIMVVAVIGGAVAMIVFARWVSGFVERHPTIKILALSFLILIGLNLMVEGFHVHVPKGYIHFAMAFSLTVELLNLRLRKRDAIRLRRERLPTHVGQ
ncbi:MAG: TerC family protein [Phycisphaeraceae bacterium]